MLFAASATMSFSCFAAVENKSVGGPAGVGVNVRRCRIGAVKGFGSITIAHFMQFVELASFEKEAVDSIGCLTIVDLRFVATVAVGLRKLEEIVDYSEIDFMAGSSDLIKARQPSFTSSNSP